jgi:hypothetical protein
MTMPTPEEEMALVEAMPDGPEKHRALRAWNAKHIEGWQPLNDDLAQEQ